MNQLCTIPPMIRTNAVLICLLLRALASTRAEEKPSHPSIGYDVARTHEIKPHRRAIPVECLRPPRVVAAHPGRKPFARPFRNQTNTRSPIHFGNRSRTRASASSSVAMVPSNCASSTTCSISLNCVPGTYPAAINSRPVSSGLGRTASSGIAS